MRGRLTAALTATVLIGCTSQTTYLALDMPAPEYLEFVRVIPLPVPKPEVPAIMKHKGAQFYVRHYAAEYGVPEEFALRIAYQETRIRCGLVGGHGERGPLQVLPSTARGMGYKNIAKNSCAVQTEAGMKHLAMCWEEAKGNRRAAARCHNGGPGKTWSKNKKVNAYASSVLGASLIKVIPTADITVMLKDM